jgi:hypothetical protein
MGGSDEWPFVATPASSSFDIAKGLLGALEGASNYENRDVFKNGSTFSHVKTRAKDAIEQRNARADAMLLQN